jgi:hypothetical protein
MDRLITMIEDTMIEGYGFVLAKSLALKIRSLIRILNRLETG